MVKVKEMPIRQEKQLSSEFHMQMLRELETHHDEKSDEKWDAVNEFRMMRVASTRIEEASRLAIHSNDPAAGNKAAMKQLVHAANFLTIAWAAMKAKT